MKIKSVSAALAAAAVFCACGCAAFAETTPVELSANDLLGSPNTVDDAREAVSAEKTADSGVEGVSAVAGVIALAGAAVVISRKKA